jgi:hypothetical protein
VAAWWRRRLLLGCTCAAAGRLGAANQKKTLAQNALAFTKKEKGMRFHAHAFGLD